MSGRFPRKVDEKAFAATMAVAAVSDKEKMIIYNIVKHLQTQMASGILDEDTAMGLDGKNIVRLQFSGTSKHYILLAV